jgi:hypothetical protein
MLKWIAGAILATIIAGPAWAGATEDKAAREAAHDLDLDRVKAALKNGANPNALDPTSQLSPLGMVGLANMLGVDDPAPEMKEAGFMDREIANSKAFEIAKALIGAGAKLGSHDREILYLPDQPGEREAGQTFDR